MTFFGNAALIAAQAKGVYYAFEVSDGMGQSIVILLLVASVVTWALMIDKYYALSFVDRTNSGCYIEYEVNW